MGVERGTHPPLVRNIIKELRELMSGSPVLRQHRLRQEMRCKPNVRRYWITQDTVKLFSEDLSRASRDKQTLNLQKTRAEEQREPPQNS